MVIVEPQVLMLKLNTRVSMEGVFSACFGACVCVCVCMSVRGCVRVFFVNVWKGLGYFQPFYIGFFIHGIHSIRAFQFRNLAKATVACFSSEIRAHSRPHRRAAAVASSPHLSGFITMILSFSYLRHYQDCLYH